MLNQLVTELAWEATPAACSPRAPNRSKRSRVSLNDCGGGARPASSEGVLTNPPSPAVSWEGEGEGEGGGGHDGDKRDEEDRSNEPSQGPQDGIGSRSHQVRTRMRKAFALCDHVGRGGGGGGKVDFAAAAVLV